MAGGHRAPVLSEPLAYIDRSRIRPGKLDQLRRGIDDRFIDEREPQLLHDGFYLDEASSRMTVVAVHPDPSSVEWHMLEQTSREGRRPR